MTFVLWGQIFKLDISPTARRRHNAKASGPWILVLSPSWEGGSWLEWNGSPFSRLDKPALLG